MFENVDSKKDGFPDILKIIEKEIIAFNVKAEAS